MENGGGSRSPSHLSHSDRTTVGFDGFLISAYESLQCVLGLGAEVTRHGPKPSDRLAHRESVPVSIFAVTAMIAATLLFALLRF